jgi:hypothetical protein
MSCCRSRCRLGLIVGVFAVLAACSRAEESGTAGQTTSVPQAQAQVPAPPSFTSPDQADRAAVVTYARSLRFVSDPLRMDEQTISVSGNTRTIARIEPTDYSASLSPADRARGAIIARFVSTGVYAPVGLRRGVQYMWVDSTASGWRALMVPEDPSLNVSVTQLRIFSHVLPSALQVASARWFETNVGFLPNLKCGKECCVACVPLRAGITCPDPWMFKIEPDRLPPATWPGGRDPRFGDSAVTRP